MRSVRQHTYGDIRKTRIHGQPELAAALRLGFIHPDAVDRALRPTKRLTTEAIDGSLGISSLPFEPDDFSQSQCPQLPSTEVGFDAVNDRCRCIRAVGP